MFILYCILASLMGYLLNYVDVDVVAHPFSDQPYSIGVTPSMMVIASIVGFIVGRAGGWYFVRTSLVNVYMSAIGCVIIFVIMARDDLIEVATNPVVVLVSILFFTFSIVAFTEGIRDRMFEESLKSSI